MLRRAMLSLLIATLAMGAAAVAHAVDPMIRVVLDVDNDSTTGCDIELIDPSSPGGTTKFEGAEYTAGVGVDATADPVATFFPHLITCPPGSGTAESSELPVALDVAINEGFDGVDGVALQIPLSLIGNPDKIRVGIEATTVGGSSDRLVAVNGQPIVLDVEALAADVPGLATYGFIVLSGLLLWVGIFSASKKSRLLAGLGAVVLLLAAGMRGDPAYGDTSWLALFAGLDPIAVDSQGDSENHDSAADIWAILATLYDGNLVFQITLADLEISSSIGCPDICGCHTLSDGSCECIRVRKEVHSMTVEERTRYIDTFKAAYDAPNSVLRQHIDGHLQFFSRGLHNNGTFLPWHRGCMLAVENILQAIDCRVTIPYWNWRLNPQLVTDTMWGNDADDFSGDGGANRCVTDGTFGFTNGFALTNGRCLQRRISGSSVANEATVQVQLMNRYPLANQYDNFRNRLEHGPGLHDSVHCIVGGTMCSARSSNDPVFFMHHANIDKIWLEWQDQSAAHLNSYSGNTPLNDPMPTSVYTPAHMLDNENLPSFNGCSVKVVYDVDRCGPGFPCGAGLVCVAEPALAAVNTCDPNCPECTGICLTEESQAPDPTCTSDMDCATDEWCRPAENGESICVVFQDEGEECNCDKDLSCTATESAALLCGDEFDCQFRATGEPGMCVRPCDQACGLSSSGDYCSPIGSCREVGTCRLDVDCDVAENVFEGKLSPSEGYGFCAYGECKSECGDAKCVDLAGLDFGQCGEVLGWGRLWGVCQKIVGCSGSDAAERFSLFPSESGCNSQCIDYVGCREDCEQSCSTESCLEACFDACECKLR